MSSTAGFFDVVYLGIFIILSSTLDKRFEGHSYAAGILCDERKNAVLHFHSLLQIFSQRFIIVLDGQPISHSYVVNRMLGEFAAAIVVFSKALSESHRDDQDITRNITGVIKYKYPAVFPYFLECVEQGHKHFLWTGPDLQIFQHSEGCDSVMPLLTLGELLDLPGHQIYRDTSITDIFLSSIPTAIFSPSTEEQPVQEDSSDVELEHRRKRRR
jgi:hypothetical protein